MKSVAGNVNSVEDSEIAPPQNKIFGIHGGGNIGLGLMAEIVSKSHVSYHMIATSNDTFLVNMINSTNRYFLHHKSNELKSSTTLIQNVKMISRKSHDII